MLPIKYPGDKAKFDKAYCDALAPYIDKAVDTVLTKIKHPDGQPLSWRKMVVSSFNQLLSIHAAIGTLTDADTAILTPLTLYDKRQPVIADFFMEQADLTMMTCYYCNIDTIYSFSEIGDYKDGFDFIKRADVHDFQLISGIGPAKAEVIIAKRTAKPFLDLDDCPVSDNIRSRIKALDRPNTHNHFTLDHFFDKGTHKEISLCLYNLVPCCYPCNSKFKKTKQLYETDPIYSSPSSAVYSFHQDVAFAMYYHLDEDSVKDLADFSVELEINRNQESHARFISQLKLRGRYFAFKHEAINLLKLKRKYPESRLIEMAREAGQSIEQVRKDIFGKELYEAKYDQQTLVKYKRDIARNIKLLP